MFNYLYPLTISECVVVCIVYPFTLQCKALQLRQVACFRVVFFFVFFYMPKALTFPNGCPIAPIQHSFFCFFKYSQTIVNHGCVGTCVVYLFVCFLSSHGKISSLFPLTEI